MTHRPFIQFMISHGCVHQDQLRGVAAKIFGEEPTDDEINRLVSDSNKLLNPYNMMIRTKDKHYVLISTVDNDITRASTRYHCKQVEFFKHLLQSIITEPRGMIPYGQVRTCAEQAQLPSSTKFKSIKHEYETLFMEWTTKKWFKMVEKDFVTLDVRSLAELDVLIRQKAANLDCRNCGDMAIYSVVCARCKSRYHKACSKLFFEEEAENCRTCTEKPRKRRA